MQKKALFVAMFCGALCLTGCLKNIESDSVAEVRKAKASELNSIASLNNAKAQAETTIAAAQAALIQAQAKLEEAQAALVNAQAETERVNAELRAVEVELMKVNVDIKKVELEMKKAELQAKLAQLEVAKAKAARDIQEIANQLADLKAQAELSQIEYETELLAASEAYAKALAQADEATFAYVESVLDSYFKTVEEINSLSIEILDTQIAIALIGAGKEAALEAVAEYVAEKEKEIAQKELLLAAVKEYQDLTPEQIEELKTPATVKLIEANNALAEARKAYGEAKRDLNKKEDFIQNNTAYAEGINAGAVFAQFAKNHGAFRTKDDSGEGNAIVWFNRETRTLDTLVILQHKEKEYIFYPEEDQEVYGQAIEEGYTHVERFYDVTAVNFIVPSSIDQEAFKAFYEAKRVPVVRKADRAKARAEREYNSTVEENEAIIKEKTPWVEAYQQYIDAVQPQFDEAESAIEDAYGAWGEAEDAVDAAQLALDLAQVDNHEVEEAKAAVRAAFKDVREARRNLRIAYRAPRHYVEEFLDAIYNEELEEQFELILLSHNPEKEPDVAAEDRFEYKTVEKMKYDFARADAKFLEKIKLAEKDMEDARNEVNDFKKGDPKKEGYKTIQEVYDAYDAAKDAYEDALEALVDLKEDWEKAIIKYAGSGAKADEDAMKDAEKAYKDKYAAIFTDVPAEEYICIYKRYVDLDEAIYGNGGFDSQYTELEAKANTAETKHSDLVEAHETWFDETQEIVDNFEDALAAIETAKQALEDAKAICESAIEDKDEIVADFCADEWAALNAAEDQAEEAKGEFFAAVGDLRALNQVYKNYGTYKNNVDPRRRGSVANQIARAERNIARAETAFEAAKKAADEYISDYDDEYKAAKENIEALASVEKAYTTEVNSYNEMSVVAGSLWYIKEAAEEAQIAAKAELNALRSARFVDENGERVNVNDKIAEIEAEIDKIEAEIAETENLVAAGLYNVEKLVQNMKLAVAEKETRIKYLTVKAEYYASVLAEYGVDVKSEDEDTDPVE